MKFKNKDKKKQEQAKKDELPKQEQSPQEEIVEDVNVEEKVDPKDEEIEKLKTEVARLKNAYALAYADTENMKKRLDAEAQNAKKYRIQSFALDILPVLDNLERALNACEDKEDQFYKGVKMIYDQLIVSLEKEGVKEVDCIDKKFDPNFEQSIMVEKKEGVEPNTVIEVLQKGYMLKDRVLRAAMVKVSE